MTRAASFLFAGALIVVSTAVGAQAPSPPKAAGTLIDFRAEAQKAVPNDLGRAVAYIEATAADPAELSRRVNANIAAALATAKAHAGVRVRTGSSHTYPVYAKGSRSIESWRMRSELMLESRDAAALSALLGSLQSRLAIGQLDFMPSPETRRAAEDEAALEAIAAFQTKAARYAAALKKPYRIRSMSVGSGGTVPPRPLYRGAMMAADAAAPMPVEAGESNVTVTVTGQIELAD